MILARSRPALSALANTVNLGIHVFNPHRFNGVLRELADATEEIVPEAQVASYFESAERCFQNAANLKLVNIPSVVDTLAILREEFPGSSVYATLMESLIESVDSEAKVVQLAYAAIRGNDTQILNQLRSKLDLIPHGSRNRIRLAQLHASPGSYLQHFTTLSGRNLLQLPETDLAKIVQVCCKDLSDSQIERFVDAIEVLLSHRIQEAQGTRAKLEIAQTLISTASNHESLAIMCERLFESKLVDVIDLLSPSQSIDILAIFSSGGNAAKTAWTNLAWKIHRDSKYLSTVTARHLAQMLRVVPSFAHTDREMSALVAQIGMALDSMTAVTMQDTVSLCNAFNVLPGMPWVEHRPFADRLFDTILSLTKSSVCVAEMTSLVRSLSEGLEISDPAIIMRLVDRFSFRSVEDRIHVCSVVEECANRNTSRIGNLVMLKLLTRDSSDFNKITDALKLNHSIPLHARLNDLSGSQLIDLVVLVGQHSKQTLSDLEQISHASSIASESVEVQLELFSQFTQLRFPCKALMESIAVNIKTLDALDVVELLHCCALGRIRPDIDLNTWEGMNTLDATAISSLIGSTASLGMLANPRVTNALLNRFLQTASGLDSIEQSRQAAAVLSNVFLSLTVPNDQQIHALVKLVSNDPVAIDEQDKAVISEMSSIVESEPLKTLVEGFSVCTEQVEALRPDGLRSEDLVNNSELSQSYKFKLFLGQNRA